MGQFKNLTPAEVLERSGSIPSMSIVGGSGVGKTTAANNLLNPRVAVHTSVGIGEKNQTTNIASNFILDSRIASPEEFAILIKKKDLDKKLILQKIFEAVADEFSDNDYDVEETVESMEDGDWADKFLEPKDASYHLETIKDDLDIKELNASIKGLLKKFDLEEFEQKVTERKKVLGKKAPKLKTLKRTIFTENVLDPKLNNSVMKWVESIENIIINKLKKVFKVENPFKSSFTHTVEGTGKEILIELYDPYKPYSLIIDYIDIASRPREEAIRIMGQKDSEIPLRMKLVDTIGISQEGVDEDSLTAGMDRALARSVNGIILIIDLEEREDTIQNIFEALNEKLSKLKSKSDIYIMFSKGDKLVETKIDKRKTDLAITQQDYDNAIEIVLEEVSKLVKGYSNQVKSGVAGIRWQALSYKDEAIDHRIIAIKNHSRFSEEEKKEKVSHFLPEGLFNFVINSVYEQQLKMLPKGVSPILVTVNNIEKNPLKVTILEDKLKDILDSIAFNLSQNDSVVGQYKGLPDPKAEYHHSSVIAYYSKLKNGQGHTVKGEVYNKFSVNMKALLWNNLEKYNFNLKEILSRAAIDISTDNLEDKEVYNIVKKLENRDFVTSSKDERELLKNKYLELVNSKVNEINQQIQNQISMKISYENEFIKSQIDGIYFNPSITYTQTFKLMQTKFRDIFASEQFKEIICNETSIAISEIINSGFIVI